MATQPLEHSMIPCGDSRRAFVTITLHETHVQLAAYDAQRRGYPSLEADLERLLSDGIERNSVLAHAPRSPRLELVK